MKFKKRDKEGVFKSLFAAYFVILLHVFLLAGTGVTVVLFRGVYNYLPWIMGGLSIMILGLFWIFYTKMKKSSSDIKDILSFPEFRDRNIEISLLGGLASFKIEGGNRELPLIGQNFSPENPDVFRLEGPKVSTDKRISDLADLYDRDLITKEEFDLAKKDILYA